MIDRNYGKSRVDLLPRGMYYKANLHCHTTLSDGNMTPEEIKRMYRARGYSIVAYTDHRIYRNHLELNDKDFLALAAYEVNINQKTENIPMMKVYHLNLYDTDPGFCREEKEKSPCPQVDYEDIEGINRYLEEMKRLGFWICYNHPYWSLQTEKDFLPLEHVSAMEIFNYGCELDGLYGYNPRLYDAAVRAGKHWYCLATDDNHNAYPEGHGLCDSFGGFTMICPEDFTYDGVVKALQKGAYYASMGPEFQELYVEEGILHIKTTPVEKIFVAMQGRDCYRKAASRGNLITEAAFPLTGKEGYLRVEVQDERGKYASTNAYPVNDFLNKNGGVAK